MQRLDLSRSQLLALLLLGLLLHAQPSDKVGVADAAGSLRADGREGPLECGVRHLAVGDLDVPADHGDKPRQVNAPTVPARMVLEDLGPADAAATVGCGPQPGLGLLGDVVGLPAGCALGAPAAGTDHAEAGAPPPPPLLPLPVSPAAALPPQRSLEVADVQPAPALGVQGSEDPRALLLRELQASVAAELPEAPLVQEALARVLAAGGPEARALEEVGGPQALPLEQALDRDEGALDGVPGAPCGLRRGLPSCSRGRGLWHRRALPGPLVRGSPRR
mmetsp:Transcript_91838/g.284028  ORF Transcript_91838/g.284028 Transcript_91838/m.284028 type:complete len:277 (-) Transcript_91838:826-1656(-)